MNNAAPENTAALQEKIAELEQQLKLSDEGASHLAERCLALEQKVQSYLAAHPQREMHTDSPTLLQPLLYYDAGFGFSEKDTLTAPDCTTDELTGAVTATFELPVAVQALRFDPGELPCCITNLIFSDDRIICVPTNGLNLSGGIDRCALHGRTRCRVLCRQTLLITQIPLCTIQVRLRIHRTGTDIQIHHPQKHLTTQEHPEKYPGNRRFLQFSQCFLFWYIFQETNRHVSATVPQKIENVTLSTG